MATRTLVAAKPEIIESNYISQGFVELPLEIIYQIMSAAQGAIIPCMTEAAMEKKYSERRDSLLALCQVCRSLRVALLSLLWERLEAQARYFPTGDQGDRLLVKLLAGQLEVISITQPLYASYVRIVNIAIKPDVAPRMLSNLAPALALMPNLHTIQIIIDSNHPDYQAYNVFQLEVDSDTFCNAFKGQCYPSVKRVILPEQATILECFPEVCEVCLNQLYDPFQDNFFKLLNNVAKKCNKLERFGWIDTPFLNDEGSRAAAIAKELPKIRRLEYHIKELNVNEISQLAGLKNLEDFSLVIDAYDDLSQCDDAALEVIGAAKKVLAASSSINKRLDVILRAETRSFII